MRTSAQTIAGIVIGALLMALFAQLGRWDAEADAAFARARNCEALGIDCRSAR